MLINTLYNITGIAKQNILLFTCLVSRTLDIENYSLINKDIQTSLEMCMDNYENVIKLSARTNAITDMNIKEYKINCQSSNYKHF